MGIIVVQEKAKNVINGEYIIRHADQFINQKKSIKLKKFICFIVGITLALISFSASADTFTFTGSSYRVYRTSDNGQIIGDVKTIYENYRIVINIDDDIVKLKSGDSDYTFYIKSTESFEDKFRGIYLHCAGDLTVNIYSDHNGNKHIIIKTGNVASIFDI